ncbi:uncharacterized protein [Trachinotus anak]|uniref:uncharacterized protein n=1 Tax=Trachinotus anak TaxID=443729 RepID=UPI0039F206CF
MMGHNHQHPPRVKHFRRLKCVIASFFGVTIVTCVIYRPDKSNRAMAKPQTPSNLTLIQQCQRQAPQGGKLSLVAVDRMKTLLVSAYQEHRTEQKEVRVIAAVLRDETVAYQCIFCCQHGLHVSEGVRKIHDDHFGFVYGTADIMCPLPSGCETPSHITVTSASATSEDKDKSDQKFVEVMNQKEKSDSFPYDFTVCISTMFDFTNVLQLVQSLEMLQLLGVNRVVIYKTSCNHEIQRILDYYTHTGLVEVLPWRMSSYLNVSRSWLPEHGPGDLHYFGQIPALNDCLYRYMYQSKYVALQDIDELILPQSVNSWLELLPVLEKKYGVDQCYMFENNVFPHDVEVSQPTSCCPGWESVSGVNILAHLHCEPNTADTQYSNFKTIVNPRAVFTATVHGLLDQQKGCSWVDRNIARMYHTRAAKRPELKPDQLIYDDRLLSYSKKLKLAVNAVLRKSGFLPNIQL